jgi:hypothetical protein
VNIIRKMEGEIIQTPAQMVVSGLRKTTCGIFWAKLSAYPPWPARFASAPEVESLEAITKSSDKAKQVAVVFLGTNKTRYVPAKCDVTCLIVELWDLCAYACS